MSEHSLAKRTVIAGVVSGALALLLAMSAVSWGTGTPFDEHAHLDYAYKLSTGDYPDRYALLDQEPLRVFTCAGPIEVWGPTRCGGEYIDPTTAPFGGVSYSTTNHPVGYIAPAVAIAVSRVGGGTGELLTAGRTGSALYGAILAFLASGVLIQLGRSIALSISGGVIVTSLPSSVLAFSHVTNDASALALVLGSAFVWLALRERSAPVRLGFALAIGVVALLVKQTAVLAFILPLWLEYVQSVTQLRARSRAGAKSREASTGQIFSRPRAAIIGAGFVGGIAYFALTRIDAAMRPLLPGPVGMSELLGASAPPWRSILERIPDNVLDAQYAYYGQDGALSTPMWNFLALVVTVIAFGGGLLMLLNPRLSRSSLVANAYGVSLLALLGFVFLMAFWIATMGGVWFFQPRYLLPSLVAVIVFAVATVHPRREWAVLVFAAALYLVALDHVSRTQFLA